MQYLIDRFIIPEERAVCKYRLFALQNRYTILKFIFAEKWINVEDMKGAPENRDKENQRPMAAARPVDEDDVQQEE